MIWRRGKKSVPPCPSPGIGIQVDYGWVCVTQVSKFGPIKIKKIHPILGLGQFIVNNQAMASVQVYPLNVVRIVSNIDALFEFGIFNLCR